MINFTDTAVKHLQEKISSHQYLKIEIKRSGCSGYSYDCSIVEQIPKDFEVLFANGIQVVYSPTDYKRLDGLVVDYRRQGLGSRLTYINPNEVARCGCGESIMFSAQ